MNEIDEGSAQNAAEASKMAASMNHKVSLEPDGGQGGPDAAKSDIENQKTLTNGNDQEKKSSGADGEGKAAAILNHLGISLSQQLDSKLREM